MIIVAVAAVARECIDMQFNDDNKNYSSQTKCRLLAVVVCAFYGSSCCAFATASSSSPLLLAVWSSFVSLFIGLPFLFTTDKNACHDINRGFSQSLST